MRLRCAPLCSGALLLMVACHRAPVAQVPAAQVLNDALPHASKPLATLARSGCLGSCPVYIIEVLENGRVEYEGFQYIEPKGTLFWQIGSDGVRELLAAFNRASFPSLWNSDDGILDVEIASISLAASGTEKRTFYTRASGSENRTRLLQLETDFERIAGIWRHAREVDFEPPKFPVSVGCGSPRPVRKGKRSYVAGEVHVRYLVDRQGLVERIQAIGPTDARLFHEVSRWLTNCQFEPLRLSTGPKAVNVEQSFLFRPRPVSGPGRGARR